MESTTTNEKGKSTQRSIQGIVCGKLIQNVYKYRLERNKSRYLGVQRKQLLKAGLWEKHKKVERKREEEHYEGKSNKVHDKKQ